MITWKFALMAIFGLSNYLPMQSAGESKPKVDVKPGESKPTQVQVEVKKAEAEPKAKAFTITVNKADPSKANAPDAKEATITVTKVESPKAEPAKKADAKVGLFRVEGAKPTTATTTNSSTAQTFTIIKSDSTKTEGVKSTAGQVTVTKVEEPKSETPRKVEIKEGVFKFEAAYGNPTPHVIQLQVLPSGEVKVIQSESADKAKPHVVVGTGTEPNIQKLNKVEGKQLFAVVQGKPEQPKPEAAGTRTIELRIEIKGDGPPKVQVIKSQESKVEMPKTGEAPKVEMRRVEVHTPPKVNSENKTIEIKKPDGKTTGSLIIGNTARTFPIPSGTGAGVMKIVISEDGKGFKVESEGNAKTEVIELHNALMAADKAQAQAMELREKAEAMRNQAVKEADEARIQTLQKIELKNLGELKDLEKHLQLKLTGDMKDLHRQLETRLVESKAKKDAEMEKFEQLSKRLERLEKAIDELAKKIK